jgi:hypothetical protein
MFAVCRLRSDEEIPTWASSGSFYSLTRTPDEFSIVCLQELVPKGVAAELGFRALKVEGKLDFQMIGILSSITSALAIAGISVFTISTFGTDYIFVKAQDLNLGVTALRNAGHQVVER